MSADPATMNLVSDLQQMDRNLDDTPLLALTKRRPMKPLEYQKPQDGRKAYKRNSRRTSLSGVLHKVSKSSKVVLKAIKGELPWSMTERHQLLAALKKHSHQDWDALCKSVPTRSKQQIEDYMHELRGAVDCKEKIAKKAQLTWLPIESWFDLSTEMTHYEQCDLSKIVSRVFSMIGNFSDFPKPSDPALQPDYSKLYLYIAGIMDESLSMPELSPLESALMVDLMHSLGDLLRMSDTAMQRKVMCWKYKMLNHRFDMSDVPGTMGRIRSALTNDFSSLQKNKEPNASSAPHTVTSTTAASKDAASLPEADQASQPGAGKSPRPASAGKEVPSNQCQSQKGGSSLSANVSKDTPNQPERDCAQQGTPGNSVDLQSPSSQKGQCKGSEDGTPGKDPASVMNNGSQGVTSEGPEAQPASTSAGRLELNSSKPGESVAPPVKRLGRPPKGASAKIQQQQNTGQASEQSDAPPVKRKRGRPPLDPSKTVQALEKPRLYSMNPFCVPIRMLSFKSLRTPSGQVLRVSGPLVSRVVTQPSHSTAKKTDPPTAAKTDPPTAANTYPPTAAKTNPPTAAKTNPPTAVKTNPPTAAKTNPPTAAKTNPPTAAKTNPPTAAKTNPPTAARAKRRKSIEQRTKIHARRQLEAVNIREVVGILPPQGPEKSPDPPPRKALPAQLAAPSHASTNTLQALKKVMGRTCVTVPRHKQARRKVVKTEASGDKSDSLSPCKSPGGSDAMSPCKPPGGSDALSPCKPPGGVLVPVQLPLGKQAGQVKSLEDLHLPANSRAFRCLKLPDGQMALLPLLPQDSANAGPVSASSANAGLVSTSSANAGLVSADCRSPLKAPVASSSKSCGPDAQIQPPPKSDPPKSTIPSLGAKLPKKGKGPKRVRPSNTKTLSKIAPKRTYEGCASVSTAAPGTACNKDGQHVQESSHLPPASKPEEISATKKKRVRKPKASDDQLGRKDNKKKTKKSAEKADSKPQSHTPSSEQTLSASSSGATCPGKGLDNDQEPENPDLPSSQELSPKSYVKKMLAERLKFAKSMQQADSNLTKKPSSSAVDFGQSPKKAVVRPVLTSRGHSKAVQSASPAAPLSAAKRATASKRTPGKSTSGRTKKSTSTPSESCGLNGKAGSDASPSSSCSKAPVTSKEIVIYPKAPVCFPSAPQRRAKSQDLNTNPSERTVKPKARKRQRSSKSLSETAVISSADKKRQTSQCEGELNGGLSPTEVQKERKTVSGSSGQQSLEGGVASQTSNHGAKESVTKNLDLKSDAAAPSYSGEPAPPAQPPHSAPSPSPQVPGGKLAGPQKRKVLEGGDDKAKAKQRRRGSVTKGTTPPWVKSPALGENGKTKPRGKGKKMKPGSEKDSRLKVNSVKARPKQETRVGDNSQQNAGAGGVGAGVLGSTNVVVVTPEDLQHRDPHHGAPRGSYEVERDSRVEKAEKYGREHLRLKMNDKEEVSLITL